MKNEIKELLIKYVTARIDIKNHGKKDNTVLINKTFNFNADVEYPIWFETDNGQGLSIECYTGVIDFQIKCINHGDLSIRFRGIDSTDKKGNRFPIHIDYTNIEINNKKIIKTNRLTWHDEPFTYSKKVKDGEIIRIRAEWMPFSSSSEYNNELEDTKKRLEFIERKVKEIPRLSCTSFGSKAFNGKLTYRNWITSKSSRNLLEDIDGYCEGLWLTKYIKLKFPDEDFKLNIFGPFEEHNTLTSPMEGKKVFYTAEDLHLRSDAGLNEMREKYGVYALDYVDLAIGYDVIDDPKYIRFPYWLMRLFKPDVTEEVIENLIDFWNNLNYTKTDDVINISSHDSWNARAYIASDVEKFANITYAGRWRNNTRELWDKYDNDKIEYTKKFKFSLCPENVFNDAYVTEKIFESIRSNCVPLYAGGGNYLEPEVINPKAIIRWSDDMSADNSDAIDLFKNLLTDEKSYSEFREQKPFLNSTKKYIINKFADFEKQFERLIYDK